MNIEFTANVYFQEIMSKKEYEPISDNEEVKRLISKVQEGYDYENKSWLNEESLEARNILIKRNLRLVPFVLHKIKLGRHHLFMDCVSEGVFSLSKCILGYDLKSNTIFASYAQIALRRHMWRFLRENGNAIKLPFGELKKRINYEKISFNSPDNLPIHPASSISNKLDDKSANSKSQFMDIPLYETPCSIILSDENKIIIRSALECLTERERFIIDKRVLSDEKVIFNDLADEMGITRERVRQIEKEALLKMRNWISYQSEDKF